MKILTFSSLYPNAAQPRHGLFVEQRLRNLLLLEKVKSKVVAPVPWFPLKSRRFGKYSELAKAPAREQRSGIEIIHPRYLVIPKIGMALTPLTLYTAMKPVFRKIIENGYNFDLIDAHYFYPDGVAASMLGKWLNKPVCITARGTDINYIPRFKLPKKMIISAARSCTSIITVCQALKESIVEMGIPEEKITALRNGVDLNLFMPLDREAERKKLNIKGRMLVSVGYLIERKGHHIAIKALKDLPDVTLIIIGDGEWEKYLKDLAVDTGVADRVRFEGSVPQQELSRYYSAADALVLASSREGMANVMLESMACGNPVIANNCWGAPELIKTAEAGRMMAERTPEALVNAVRELFQNYPERSKTRKYAEQFSWEETSQGQVRVFEDMLNNFSGK